MFAHFINKQQCWCHAKPTTVHSSRLEVWGEMVPTTMCQDKAMEKGFSYIFIYCYCLRVRTNLLAAVDVSNGKKR